MRRVRTAVLVALGGLALLVVAAGVAYAVDSQGDDGTVARNVTLAGEDIGGLTAAEVSGIVNRLSAGYPGTAIVVSAGRTRFRGTAERLGVTVDEQATVTAALRTGTDGTLPGRVVSWVSSWVRDRRAPLKVRVDEATLRRAVRELDPGPRTEPVEPSIRADGERFVVVPGRNGRGVDAADVLEELPGAAEGGGTVHVDVERGTVAPAFPVSRARALAERAAQLVRGGVRVRAGTSETTVPEPMLREWVKTRSTDESLELALDPEEAVAGLRELLPRAGTAAVDARFQVANGAVSITPGRPGTRCCAPESADRLMEAVVQRPAGAVALPLEEVPPARTTEKAAALGIKEPVGSFRTQHACCESRVQNIHRIADIVRGAVIEPGATFSINEFVGRRTRDKGFVTAGVIQDGLFAEDIGGGVSQFATTLFNAAFFAGLEYGEYQSHSIYISRYPYGREATMGFPHPDLQIKNTTPHGVLIWPTYDATSITVTLYSTRHFSSVEPLPQSRRSRGSCTVVTTPRLRVSLDGTRKTDSVVATYRAGEGIDCNESARPRTTPTTSRPSPTTTRPAAPATTAPGTTTRPTDGRPPGAPATTATPR